MEWYDYLPYAILGLAAFACYFGAMLFLPLRFAEGQYREPKGKPPS